MNIQSKHFMIQTRKGRRLKESRILMLIHADMAKVFKLPQSDFRIYQISATFCGEKRPNSTHTHMIVIKIAWMSYPLYSC